MNYENFMHSYEGQQNQDSLSDEEPRHSDYKSIEHTNLSSWASII